MKLVKPGQISLDGTKIKANASKHKALSQAGNWTSWKRSCVRKSCCGGQRLLGKASVEAWVDRQITPLIAAGREACLICRWQNVRRLRRPMKPLAR